MKLLMLKLLLPCVAAAFSLPKPVQRRCDTQPSALPTTPVGFAITILRERKAITASRFLSRANTLFTSTDLEKCLYYFLLWAKKDGSSRSE